MITDVVYGILRILEVDTDNLPTLLQHVNTFTEDTVKSETPNKVLRNGLDRQSIAVGVVLVVRMLILAKLVDVGDEYALFTQSELN